jgi:hypothetical protein
MALTAAEQAQLDALQAQANAPEPRTADGLKGVLHTILDVLSGTVAHLPEDAWKTLHTTVEFYDAEHDGQDPGDGQEPGAAG